MLKSPTWTERNLLYAGDVVAFSPPTDRPKNIPANELTYLSQGLAINSQRGVFANRSFNVGERICIFVGKLYPSSTPVLSNGEYVEEFANRSRVDPYQPNNKFWPQIKDTSTEKN